MEKLQKEIPVTQFLQECVDVPFFENCCRACPNHGKTWSCPPFSFQPEETWAKYDTVLLQCRVIPVSRELQAQTFSLEQLNRRSTELLREEKRAMLLETLELEKQYPGSLALSAGSCDLCAEGSCTRLRNEPCRNPGMMRYSVEALGGDVGKALKLYFDKEILWGKDGHMPPYYILLGGLLKPKSAPDEPREEQRGLSMKPEDSRYSFFQHRDCEFFPCHKTEKPEDFNCLFCYCPLYTLGSACGGDCRWLPDGTKDCSGCMVPHGRNSYSYVISRFGQLAALAKQNR